MGVAGIRLVVFYCEPMIAALLQEIFKQQWKIFKSVLWNC